MVKLRRRIHIKQNCKNKRISSNRTTALIVNLTVDVEIAGRLDAAKPVGHLASVPSGIAGLGVFDRKRRLVVPEEYLVLAARINFARIFEPAKRHQRQLLRLSGWLSETYKVSK